MKEAKRVVGSYGKDRTREVQKDDGRFQVSVGQGITFTVLAPAVVP